MRNVLLCECGYAQVLEPGTLRAVSHDLSKAGLKLEKVRDLCGVAARREPLLSQLAAEAGLTVLACHPRAVKALFAAAGAPLPPDAELINLRTGHAEDAVSRVLKRFPGATVPPDSLAAAESPESTAQPTTPNQRGEEGWLPWFPVLDPERCNHCFQCLNFCLFGVYGSSPDGRVVVRAPENCKANCPACARLCPELAIIFPKFKTGPVNGADISHNANREAVKVDISSALGGDVYSKLRSRGQPRFSKDRDTEKGLRERQEFLARLAEAGELPPELLRTLGNIGLTASPRAPKGQLDEDS